MIIMMFVSLDDSQVPGQQHPHQGEHQAVLKPQHAEHLQRLNISQSVSQSVSPLNLRRRYPEPTKPDHLQGEEDRTEEISEATAGEIRENTSYRVTWQNRYYLLSISGWRWCGEE